MWTALFVLALNAAVHGFPTGAPESRCFDPRPKHPGAVQFNADDAGHLHLNQTRVDFIKGDDILVVLSSSELPFKGFLIKSFLENGTEYGGYFMPGAKGVKLLQDCSAATHDNNDPKQEISVVWRADIDEGSVFFIATVVESFKKYFVGIGSWET
ncbi:putative defense protein 1 [Ornithodoros turicata]|uniref:putative defense protein 1 n=1 Tax=Ornithodoros turicata TaxID=34597 RepID=UPI003138E9A1